ncbi:MAG: sensor histidine kinase [Candidatus Methylacidiphilales bacterium]
MKKSTILIITTIFFPSLLLGMLALHAAFQQHRLIEEQEARLRQQETDALAARVRLALASEHAAFISALEETMAGKDPLYFAERFNDFLPTLWALGGTGFVVSDEGQLLHPSTENESVNPELLRFNYDNAGFLNSLEDAMLYPSAPGAYEELARSLRIDDSMRLKSSAQRRASELVQQKDKLESKLHEPSTNYSLAVPQQQVLERNVAPLKGMIYKDQASQSATVQRLRSRFNTITEGTSDGILARITDDRLVLIFWSRPSRPGNLVFGVQLDPNRLKELLRPLLSTDQEKGSSKGFYSSSVHTALLDERGNPFLQYPEDFIADWKRPFVASAIGETLPYWEASLYLADPAALQRSARFVTLSLVSLIALAVGAIALGTLLVERDTRRQLALARQKTDFVSNVSHELKTPLTSIRMFAEMLLDPGHRTTDKLDRYLPIISMEAERLTRLINNVLDFSRMDRGLKSYHMEYLDAYPLIARVWQAQKMHWDRDGLQSVWHASDPPYPIRGDADAINQILLNLFSNAEKYASEGGAFELHTWTEDEHLRVSVLDRGSGVPDELQEKVFEQFFRAHDSLDSGIQGSGLGLTLARRLARDHGGDLVCQSRPGGGSCFTLTLPLHQTPL